MQVQPVIFGVTAACRKSFVKCEKIERLMKKDWAMHSLAHFNFWAYEIGASAPNRKSLDARLLLRPLERDIIANLLRGLDGMVEDCMVLGRVTLVLRLSIVINMIRDCSSSIGHSERCLA